MRSGLLPYADVGVDREVVRAPFGYVVGYQVMFQGGAVLTAEYVVDRGGGTGHYIADLMV